MLHIECVVWEQALQLARGIGGSCSVLPKSSELDIAAAAATSGAL